MPEYPEVLAENCAPWVFWGADRFQPLPLPGGAAALDGPRRRQVLIEYADCWGPFNVSMPWVEITSQ